MVHPARKVCERANHTHLSELLSEREGLDMGRTTLRRILVNAGINQSPGGGARPSTGSAAWWSAGRCDWSNWESNSPATEEVVVMTQPFR